MRPTEEGKRYARLEQRRVIELFTGAEREEWDEDDTVEVEADERPILGQLVVTVSSDHRAKFSRFLPGRRYGQIQAGRLRWVFVDADMPNCDPAIEVVDITELSPQPQEGDEHLGGASFGPPPSTLTPKQDADRARRAEYHQAIEDDATIAGLKAMSNAEFDAWWTANVTNAGQTNAMLRRLARVILVRLL